MLLQAPNCKENIPAEVQKENFPYYSLQNEVWYIHQIPLGYNKKLSILWVAYYKASHITKLEFKRLRPHRPKLSNTSYEVQSSWRRLWACLDAVLSHADAARQQSRPQANEIERLDVLPVPGSFRRIRSKQSLYNRTPKEFLHLATS
jgi:hypothetical protein